jgi:hypothetical protein
MANPLCRLRHHSSGPAPAAKTACASTGSEGIAALSAVVTHYFDVFFGMQDVLAAQRMAGGTMRFAPDIRAGSDQKLVDKPAYKVRRGPCCGAPTPTPEPSRNKYDLSNRLISARRPSTFPVGVFQVWVKVALTVV